MPYVAFSAAAPAKSGGNGPDFVVLAKPPVDNADYELGAAWSKTSKKGNAYLSVKLDSPALARLINCALTRQQDGSYALVWNRAEARAGEHAVDAEAAA